MISPAATPSTNADPPSSDRTPPANDEPPPTVRPEPIELLERAWHILPPDHETLMSQRRIVRNNAVCNDRITDRHKQIGATRLISHCQGISQRAASPGSSYATNAITH